MSPDNGVHEHSATGGELLEKMNGVPPTSGSVIAERNENPETVGKLEDDGIINSSTVAMPKRSIAHVESNGLTVSKDLGVKKRDPSKAPIPQKVHIKEKDDKPSRPKCAATTGVKKSKDVKDTATTSALPNGSLALSSRPKEPFSHAMKSRSANDKEQSVKSDAPSLSVNVTQPEGLLVKTKLKPSSKGPPNNAEGSIESTLSPTASDGMPRKVGALPDYNFSFKCNERAEKRKEFYCKLEEKIHAKEVEKSDLQAKTKETQEAELRMLRKSLTFKATPMPTFYQEPPPPKPELKKIPPTRAKSPKLGRKKNSPTSDDVKGNICFNLRPVRLSLGEKSENNATKGGTTTPIHLKKTQRKSLPKLPSEKTILTPTNKTNETESDETTTSPKETSEIASHAEPSYAQQPNNDQAQTNFVEEPIALEN